MIKKPLAGFLDFRLITQLTPGRLTQTSDQYLFYTPLLSKPSCLWMILHISNLYERNRT